jgi:hypothetical protein
MIPKHEEVMARSRVYRIPQLMEFRQNCKIVPISSLNGVNGVLRVLKNPTNPLYIGKPDGQRRLLPSATARSGWRTYAYKT